MIPEESQIIKPVPLPGASTQPNYSTVVSGTTLPVETADTLRLDVYTLLGALGGGGVVLRISAIERVWTGNRYDYTPIQKDIVLPNVNGLINRTELALTRGELVSVSVQVLAGVLVQYGDCFIRLSIVRNYGNTVAPVHVLIQDYVTSLGYTSWPGGRVISSPEREGALTLIDLTPAAGADVAFLVPDNSIWLIKQGGISFVADANVVNRSFDISFLDPAAVAVRRYFTEKSSFISASQTAFILLQPGSSGVADGAALHYNGAILTTADQDVVAEILLPIDFPPLLARSGWGIQTNTTNIAVGDQWSFQLSIERWTFPNVNTP